MKNRVQSDTRPKSPAGTPSGKPRTSLSAERGKSKARIAFYAVGALFVILALAYIDGGEEPLHPIVQSVSVAAMSGNQS